MTDRRTAVVTGGLGFIGSHLVESLLESDYSVTILDVADRSRTKYLPDGFDGQLEIVTHDVREPFPDVKGVDEVYHFASRASPTSFETHPVGIAMTNSLGTRNAFEFARKRDAKVVFASSSAVYGDPEESPQSEDYTGNVELRNTRAPYDEGKRFSEALAEAYTREYDMDIRTIRPFNVYGPNIRPDDGRVVPNFVSQAIRGDDLTLYGDGSQVRCFCYVTDLVRAVRRLADLPESEGRDAVVNVGNPTEMTIEELAETVLDVVDTDSDITREPRPDGDPAIRKPDISRAKRLLDWEPRVGIETGVERVAEKYREELLAVE